ncbi:NAD kinase [Saezia sanguinis]|uniref:NAD kinase n=1 Tax=Saezia sanguinis TaxID=1965230 RepID=A0A433S9P9_9BURK|nr:NAD kinase [Saezia sanguinis]RUS65466.1 NAD kinase [Saezia sanguinis]
METHFQHIALVGKYQSQSSRELLASIAQLVTGLGAHVVIEAQSAIDAGLEKKFPSLSMEQIGPQCDLVIVVGGDGTMLGVARSLAAYNMPLVGINKGRLGFITDISPSAYEEALRQILSGNYTEDKRSMISAQVWRQGEPIFSALALNEVVINRGSTSGMVDVSVEVNDHFVTNLWADGVIVSTPTGSTAYALSVGGPILYPGIQGWILAPIAPHTLSNRPIVLPDDGIVTLELVAGRESSATFDTQSLANLQLGDQVILTAADQRVRFLHPLDWSYYETLRNKLRWYAGNN